MLKEVLPVDRNYYTVEEVAKRFGVTRQAVHKWISADKIKYIAPGDGKRKGYLIPKDQFKPTTSRTAEFRQRRNAIFGEGDLSLTDANEVFHSVGVVWYSTNRKSEEKQSNHEQTYVLQWARDEQEPESPFAN